MLNNLATKDISTFQRLKHDHWWREINSHMQIIINISHKKYAYLTCSSHLLHLKWWIDPKTYLAGQQSQYLEVDRPSNSLEEEWKSQ